MRSQMLLCYWQGSTICKCGLQTCEQIRASARWLERDAVTVAEWIKTQSDVWAISWRQASLHLNFNTAH